MTAVHPTRQHIPANAYRRVRWKNGAGWTREIVTGARGGTDADDWDWRLSVAELESDAAFSAFPGIEREIVLLAGNGLVLRFEDGLTSTLQPPHGRQRFAGDRALAGVLCDGRVEVFNLMWRRDAVDAVLWHRPLVGAMVLFVEPGETWALYMLAGSASCESESPYLFEQGDTVLLQAGQSRQRHVVEGGGEILLVRILPHASRQSSG